MYKKILTLITVLSTLSLLTAGAFAQEPKLDFWLEYSYTYNRNDVAGLAPIGIRDKVGGVITAKTGIEIHMPSNVKMVFDKDVATATLEGKAVENKKIAASIKPLYRDNLLSVYFPVDADFAKDEEVKITGLKVKTYNDETGDEPVRVDINADGIMDSFTTNTIRVSSTTRTDAIPPYTVTKAEAKYENNKVTLTWQNPADFDFDKTIIEKTLTRNSLPTSKFFDMGKTTQILNDSDALVGDVIQYKIKTSDTTGNLSTEVLVNITITAPPPPPPETPKEPETPPPSEETQPSEETAPEESEEATEEATEIPEKIPFLQQVTDQDKSALLSLFTDIPADHWSIPYLAALKKENIITGYDDKTMRPNEPISRAEFARMVVSAFLLNQEKVFKPDTFKSQLKDVTKDDWFYVPVLLLEKGQYITGYDDKTFKPHKEISRAEALTILMKVAGFTIKTEETVELPFDDLQKAIKEDAWFIKPIRKAYNGKIVKGYEDNTFRPTNFIIRAEAAVMIAKLKDLL